jgi:hypothetical protein
MDLDDARFAAALAAVERHSRRCTDAEVPEGFYDAEGIWKPSAWEDRGITEMARARARTCPNAYQLACRSLEHCATLEGAVLWDAIFVKYWLRELELQNGRVPPSAAILRSALKLQREATPVPPTTARRPRVRL